MKGFFHFLGGAVARVAGVGALVFTHAIDLGHVPNQIALGAYALGELLHVTGILKNQG